VTKKTKTSRFYIVRTKNKSKKKKYLNNITERKEGGGERKRERERDERDEMREMREERDRTTGLVKPWYLIFGMLLMI
jgi:hypothetical protein